MINPIRKLKNGDVNLTEEIIKNYYDDIYRYCYFKLKNKEDAKDITQEVFLSFLRNIDSYSDMKKPKAYLYTIAKNLCINFIKKNKTENLDEKKDIIDIYESQKIENISYKLTLEKIIQSLNQEDQEIINLRYIHDLKINEIAQITNKSRFSIRYSINKSLKIIQNELRGDCDVKEEIRKRFI